MSSRPRVLLVSRDATRSGAPLVLLYLLQWLRKNTDWRIEVLLLREGELSGEFYQHARRFGVRRLFSLLHEGTSTRAALTDSHARIKLPRVLAALLQLVEKLVFLCAKRCIKRGSYDLVYANSAAAGTVLSALAQAKCPIVTHIHELEYALARQANSFNSIKNFSTHYIAASQAVREHLVNHERIAAEKIQVVHEFIPTDFTDDELGEMRVRARAELKVPDDAFLVASSGTVEWRKGADLWPQFCHAVKKQVGEQEVRFVWIGANQTWDAWQVQHDLRKLEIADIASLPGVFTNPMEIYAACDVFVLPSREDPFPLVCLEAAAAGKPIVCFQNAGGMPEFVEHDCGFVVPYADVQAMADTVVELLRDKQLQAHMGVTAQHKVNERHDLNSGAAAIFAVLQRLTSA